MSNKSIESERHGTKVVSKREHVKTLQLSGVVNGQQYAHFAAQAGMRNGVRSGVKAEGGEHSGGAMAHNYRLGSLAVHKYFGPCRSRGFQPQGGIWVQLPG